MKILNIFNVQNIAILLFGAFSGLAPARAETVSFVIPIYSAATQSYFVDQAKAFEAANPGINIQIDFTNWNEIQPRLLKDAQTQTLPDGALITTRWFAQFNQKNLLTSLDGRIIPSLKTRFRPEYYKTTMIEGNTLGIVAAATTRALYFNIDIFDKIGSQIPPSHWDEFKIAAKKIKALGIAAFGLQGTDFETEIYYYYALWSYGGDLIVNARSGLDQPAAIAAAQLYQSFISEGLTQANVDQSNREQLETLFIQGKLATLITTPALAARLRQSAPGVRFGVVSVPQAQKNTTSAFLDTDAYVIFSSSKAKDNAWKFITFLSSDAARNEFDRTENLLPVTLRAEQTSLFVSDPVMKIFLDQVPIAHSIPAVSNWEVFEGAPYKALVKIYATKSNIVPILNNAVKQLNGALQQEKIH